MRETQGERVSAIELLIVYLTAEALSDNAAARRRKAAEGTRFKGKYHEEQPWNQRTAAGWTIGVDVLIRRYRIKRP